jgi:hypothetical protein
VNRIDQLLRRTQDGCEVGMGAGRECGEPVTATVLGKRVCAIHEDSARSAAEYIASVMRGQP